MDNWKAQIQELKALCKYKEAANLYEQVIEVEPEVKAHYWQLGVLLLLQGQEEEAQATWMLGMLGGIDEEIDTWTKELVEILEVEVEYQQQRSNLSVALYIRQHIREIELENIGNLLKLVQLLVEVGSFTPTVIDELEIIEAISSHIFNEQEVDLLVITLKKILSVSLLEKEIDVLINACANQVPQTGFLKESLEQIKSDIEAYQCPLCGSSDHNLLHNRGRHNKFVYNFICENCGFVFILPRPSSSKLKALYHGGLFSERERQLSVPDDNKYKQTEEMARGRFTALEKALGNYLWFHGDDKPKSILDVGCGTGSFLRLMRACGWQVLGLEPDETYAKASEQRYRISIHSQFLEELKREEQFDMVASFHVIEHIEDPNKFLKKIHSLLKEDGYLYLECPNIDKWYGDSIDFFFWDVHINTFSKNVLENFLKKNNFNILDFWWNGSWSAFLCQKSECQIVIPEHNYDNSKRIKSIVNRALKGKPLNSYEIAVGDKKQPSCLRIVHIGIHENGNAGDTLLFPAVRALFQKEVGKIDFTLIYIYSKVDKKMIDFINQHDALLIGGGGLFLRDTNGNNLSGWQWACPTQLLKKISVPIIVFAVGYNRFRDQKDFSPIFQENLEALVDKSIFFGLRNWGSVASIKKYLPSNLHCKITYQPCPTVILNRLFDSNYCRESRRIAVNIAFDRHHLRYGNAEDEILWEIGKSLKNLAQKGWEIVLFQHIPGDRDAHIWFRREGEFFREVNLYTAPPRIIIQEYSRVMLAIGMRGHAQMVPFGIGCPIISLVSHDKLRFFLEDIEHPEWGIDVHDADLGHKLLTEADAILSNISSMHEQVSLAQEKLWKRTLENLDIIKTHLLK